MNRNSTKGMNQPMKTANKSTLACIYTRARAHARTPLHTLACAWMVLIALVIGAGDAWGQVTTYFPEALNGFSGSTTWDIPATATVVVVHGVGAGGCGGNADDGNFH